MKNENQGPKPECPPGAKKPKKNEPIEGGDCVCASNIGNQDEKEDKNRGCSRYAAYANRFRTIFRAGARYLAYTSDVGESFRPVVPRALVRLGYGVSWTYVISDVSFETWKAKMRQEGRYQPGLMPWHRAPPPDKKVAALAQQEERSWKVVAVKEMVFQSVASMGLPAFTIHTIVGHSGFLFKNFKNSKIRRFGPVAAGLAIVPFLPFLFDKPVEEAVEWVTEKCEQFYERSHNPKK